MNENRNKIHFKRQCWQNQHPNSTVKSWRRKKKVKIISYIISTYIWYQM